MNKKLCFNDILIPLLVLLSAVLLVVAVASPRSVGDTRDTARKVERRLERRMRQLDSYAARPDAKLPQDMVIYVYSDDTLRSWRGRFPILNDQISGALMVQRIVTPRANFDSPLSYVGPDPVLLNLGPSWYLVKAFEDSGTRTVAGLLVANSLEAGAWGGVNPKLHIGAHFSVKPLTFSEGSAVYLDKRPVFKILYDSPTPAVTADAGLLWTALVLFLLASVLFVFRKRTLRRALIGCGCTLASTLAMYIWGHTVQTEFQIFSPMLYAGGAFLYSLGAMLLVNIAILLCTVDIYLARNEIWAKIKWPLPGGILAAADILAVVLIIAHAHSALRSVILNSNIALELYKLGGLSGYTGLIYASLLSMLTSVPMLLQMLQPVSTRLTGGRLDLFSKPLRFIWAGIVAVWFVSASAVLGFQKESNRMEVWAGRLAVDRDINLELQLLRAEHRITEDGVISSLTTAEGTETIIRNRIVDNYLLAASQNCAIGVQMLRPGSPQQVVERFRRILREGTPISEGSCFYCTPTSDGPSRYDGIFRYASSDAMIYLIVGVEQKNGVVGKGYERILSLSSGTRATIPSFYSYSRYREGDLVTFKGSYPYSTKMDDWLKVMVYNDKVSHYNRDGYVHFVNTVSDDEAVIISRRSFTFFSYIVSGIFIALMMYLLLGALQPWKKRKAPEPNSLRSRISLTLMVSLILSLVVMASVSVIFVYGRNEANRNAIMSDRINAIQLLTQNGLRTMAGEDILLSSEFAGLIQSVSDNTGSDISVYSTDGRILLSTNPEVLDHLILGYRIEAEALDQIVVGKKRY